MTPRHRREAYELAPLLPRSLKTAHRNGSSWHSGRGLQTSALGHKADVCAAKRHVCFTPESGHLAGTAGGLDPLTSLNLQIREITLDHE